MTTIDKARWNLSWLRSLTRRAEEQRLTVYERRRKLWLWTPLCALGAALIVWQCTTWEPTPVLVGLGVLMCIPWVAEF